MNNLSVPVRPDGPVQNSNPEKSRGENSSKQIQKVTKGKVVAKKPSLAKKAASTFLAEDIENVKSFVIFDVVVPAIKDTILSTISMLLWGNTNYRGRSYGNGRNERINYSTYSYSPRVDDRDRRSSSYRNSPRDFRDLIFETRVDAEEVIGALYEQIDQYGSASVADLFDFAGVTGDYTDNKWGWTRGAEFHVRPVQGGYMLDLPKVRALT